MAVLPTFDCEALYDALDARRAVTSLGWYELAAELWELSAGLNAARDGDHPICGGAVQRMRTNQGTSCQYALFMLRWLGRPPEDFLVGDVVDVGGPDELALPQADVDHRLRFDLAELHAAIDEQRRGRGLTWTALAVQLGCTPARLTNLRTARLADLTLVLRATQWLRRPSAAFVHPASW